jgi:hypothetical protein
MLRRPFVSGVYMSRFNFGLLGRGSGKSSRPIGGGQHVARLFVPAYDRGMSINIGVRRSRNSDARRRLARVFEQRRVVS